MGDVNYTYDDSGNMTYDGANTYSYDPENRLIATTKCSGPLAAACDIEALTFTTGGDGQWFAQTTESNYDGDAAQSGDIGDNEQTWLETTVEGTGTIRFDRKVSTDGSDSLSFRVDGQYKAGWTGGGWGEYFCQITTGGTHTLRWTYWKDDSGSGGSDCAWVDHVQWSGDLPDPNGWQEIAYTYDPAGRRIEKAVEGQTQVKYLYDGDHCIAEYDANDTLLRKFIHGPYVDEPICMIEVADSNATYYYHYDALGSCLALTDADANAVQLYEYSVYGRVAASDPNHTNPFMFTGRRFDADTGLYYYRARYYNPYIGRFLQTDPIGYGDGMNSYTYCRNNPLSWVDPSGLLRVAFYDGADQEDGFLVDGDGLRQMATDEHWFDYTFDMRASEFMNYETVADYILAKLAELQEKGGKITEVYLFDHGWDGTLPDPEDLGNRAADTKISEGGFTLGDELYTIDGRGREDLPMGGTIESFASRLGLLLKADDHAVAGLAGPTIHLRSCYGGRFAEEFANCSGLQTTGWTEPIAFGSPAGLHTIPNNGTADYHGHGNYEVWTPIKGMGNGAMRTTQTSWYTGF